jgi:hypothetical protein
MGVPRELRDQIYGEVLHQGDRSDPDWRGLEDPIMIDESNHTQPGLLRTSKQLREEALQIYYDGNEFGVSLKDMKLAPHPGTRLMGKLPKHVLTSVPRSLALASPSRSGIRVV